MSNYNILITEPSHGVLKKEEFLSRYSQLAQMTTNPIAKTVYEGMSYEYAEASEKQLEKLKEATEIQYQFQLTQMMVQTATMKMQLEQMKGQMQQAPEGGAAGAAK